MADINGWNEWSRHVLEELKRLNKCYDALDNKILLEVSNMEKKLEAQLNKVDIRMLGIENKLSNYILKDEIWKTRTDMKLSFKATMFGLLGSLIPIGIAVFLKIL